MDSKYWDSKCHERAKDWAHKMPCLVCGKTESEHGVQIVGHHLIRKSRSRLHRWEPLNIVALCPEHHLHGMEVCAHSENPLAVAAFVNALNNKSPQQYDFLKKNATAIRQKDMRVGPKERPDWKGQYETWCMMADDAAPVDCHRVWDRRGERE